mgnify:FL=1
MKVKKLLAVLITGMLVTGMLAGCGATDESNNDATQETKVQVQEEVKETDTGESDSTDNINAKIEVEVGYTGDMLDGFRAILSDFTAETGVQIELITPGSDYETVMKTRMASGDMPDVFITHGWSIARYKEYLLSLNDQKWIDNIDDSIKSVISDSDGNIYVLCVSQGINGIEYNKDVLDAAGVKIEDLTTMDKFIEACGKIKASGVTPMYLGGKDSWTSAGLMDNFAPAYFTAEGCAYPSGEQLKDGSFDWTDAGAVFFNDLKDMINNGYFNEDFVTADETQGFEALATGKCAFLVGGLSIDRVRTYNADAQIGIMPIPSTSDTGKMLYMAGEGSAFGIWKDSEYVDEAKQLLNYLSDASIAAKIVKFDNNIPALSNIDSANNISYTTFSSSQQTFAGKICYDNIFDREYLPSGMWSIMTDSVMEVFMDPTDKGVDTAVNDMQENYVEMMEAMK